MVKRNYKFEIDGNAAKNFLIIISDLKTIAADRKVSPQEVIRDFISDLQNKDNQDYKLKVEELDLRRGVSERFVTEATKYLNRIIKELDENQKKEEQKVKLYLNKQRLKQTWEKIKLVMGENNQLSNAEILLGIKEEKIFPELSNEERKYVIKNIEKLIANNEKEENLRKAKIEKTWEDICTIVERECPKDNSSETDYLKATIKYWNTIKDRISMPADKKNAKNKLNDSVKTEIIERINNEISRNEDSLYYGEVKYFTNNFSFLANGIEIQNAIKGMSGRKFTDKKSYMRFLDLRNLVQEGYDEYSKISDILENDEIDETDRKILTERMSVLKEERRKKEENNFGNYGGR